VFLLGKVCLNGDAFFCLCVCAWDLTCKCGRIAFVKSLTAWIIQRFQNSAITTQTSVGGIKNIFIFYFGNFVVQPASNEAETFSH
jgi:hypothetical protein